MSNVLVSDESLVQASPGDTQQPEHETNNATEDKLRVNPRRILESLEHLRIDICRIKEIESDAGSKSGGQGTVVPSILLPAGAPDEDEPNNSTNHFVAVKKLRSGDDQDWNRVIAPFAYELQLLNTLSHANIVKVIGFVEDERTGIAWMVFDWEANGNMREFVASAKFEIPERTWLINGVACGLAHLHSRNPPICHGDLKSLNILINSNFRAVITDFGSARAIASDDTSKEEARTEDFSIEQRTRTQLTSDKTIAIRVEADCFTLTGHRGTVRWAAPEILEGSRPNLATDIWAFGWICWEAITGNFPFHELGDSSGQDVQVVLSILAGALPVLRNNFELSQIQRLCSHMELCWSLDPVERPSALQCQHILQFMDQVRPEVRNPEMAEETYSSRLLYSLGRVRGANDQIDEATKYFERALEIAKTTGNTADIANALSGLGGVHRFRGEYAKAEECYAQACDAFSRIDDQRGMTNAVRSLGVVNYMRGDYAKAEEYYIQARDAYSRIDDQRGMASATNSLGGIHYMRGDYAKAEECYVQARDAESRIGDQRGTANALNSLGRVHFMRGDYARAEECHVQAHDAYSQIGDQRGMASAMRNLGEVHQRRGDYAKAEEYYIQARDAYSRIDDQRGMASATNSLGGIHSMRGDYAKAEECQVLARDAFSRIGDQRGVANASILLGNVYQKRKEYVKAIECYIAGRDIASRIDYAWALNASAKGLEEIEQVHKEPTFK